MDRLLSSLQRRVHEDPENTELRAYYATSLGRIYPASLGRSIEIVDDWQLITTLEQDAVLARLSRMLAPRYHWIGAWQGTGSLRIGRYQHVKTGLVLHLIPGGAFQMGSQHGLRDELPLLPLKLGAFLLGQWPVLNSQWQRVSPDYFRDGLSVPRSGISWYEARVWLTEAGGSLRLPSESEWEYACRGPGSLGEESYYWGAEFDARYCWSLENSGGRKRAPREHRGFENQFGLIDMSGNVWEWCDDLYKDYRSGQPYPEDVPLRLYPLRGGSYKSSPDACASTRRLAANVRQRQVDFGLRVARSLPAEHWKNSVE